MELAVGEGPFGRVRGPVGPGERVAVPLWASFLTPDSGDSLTLRAELRVWNALGELATSDAGSRRVARRPWTSEALAPLPVTMPGGPAVAVLAAAIAEITRVVRVPVSADVEGGYATDAAGAGETVARVLDACSTGAAGPPPPPFSSLGSSNSTSTT